jgi:hypothetical protein
MRILCTNQSLDVRGGSESYLETVVDELLALGHEVHAWAMRVGPGAERLVARGCRVHDDLASVGPVDVIHAQHASAALAARAHLPDPPLVFVSHSWTIDIEDPPELAAPAALVALNDAVASRLRASRLAERIPVHRLRHPVEMSSAELHRVPISDHPLVAVAVARNLSARIEMLEEACRRVGVRLEVHTSAGSKPAGEHVEAMMRADIVFGVGRTALEAMALARATFVFDESGGAGFVTAARYPEFEACGFTPAAGTSTTLDDLVSELSRYDRALGQLGRELVGRHHSARVHATELVALYRSVIGERPLVAVEPDPLRVLSTLEQRNFELEQRVRAAEWERARVQRELYKIWASASWKLTRPLRAFRRTRRERH